MKDESMAQDLMVSESLAGSSLAPARQVDEFDDIVRQSGAIPNRQVRATYDLKTRDGIMMSARHMACADTEGKKASYLNVEFNLVGATSWPTWVKSEGEGEMVKCIRTVLETDKGDMIPSLSSFLYQSLADVVRNHQGVSPDRPARVKLVKAGRTDKLLDMDALDGTGMFAEKQPSGKKSSAK